ncbi:hypothetical protein CB0940_09107 [Cercospora beticola]|uniref:Glycogenin-1 n=1 Tax=Cercospora beticola TaxID=122368 RepID=A0A2G5HFR6_CERBT|nr:hypothetical protein CB0940_09107 [Cercospora beticola]PIA91378.1 hypothetical protein CB0940_09107 [Cercospora beticola]WPB06611.1 hypothetical protein RHO25_011268 [Cercospora beticola]
MPAVLGVRNIAFAIVAIVFLMLFYHTSGGTRAPVSWSPKAPEFKGFAPLPEGITVPLSTQQQEDEKLRQEANALGGGAGGAANPAHVLPGGEQVAADGNSMGGLGGASTEAGQLGGLGGGNALGGGSLGGLGDGAAAPPAAPFAPAADAGPFAAPAAAGGSLPGPAIDQAGPPLAPPPPAAAPGMPPAPAPGMVNALPVPPVPAAPGPEAAQMPPMPAMPGLGSSPQMPPLQPNLGSTVGGTAPAAPPVSDPHFQGGFADAPFQQNLDLETPKMDILKLRRYKPHNYKGEGHPTYATHITTPGGSLNDPYFLAALQLIFRVLWDIRSGSAQYPFTAFVAPHITEEQRSVLAAAGAIVRELDSIEWHPDKNTQGRWQYNFARLNLWRQTDFSKILYLDADAFPVQNLDDLLGAATRSCRRELLPLEDQASGDEICPYTFMAAQQNLLANPTATIELNTGVMLIQPNLAMHRRLTRELTANKNWDTAMADKAFLSEMFKASGPFPVVQLAREYNGFFPGPLDEGKLKVVHEKLWVELQESAPWTKGMFREKHAEMKVFYESPAFQEVRLRDGERVY